MKNSTPIQRITAGFAERAAAFWVNRDTGTGMKVIMQTIQILNNKNKEAIDVLVHNVSLQSGEMGCEVTFWLPDNYDYGI